MFELNFKTKKKFELIDITARIEKLVAGSKIKDGICALYVPHATAAILINESADPQLRLDILDRLCELVPEHANYRHDRIDNNAQAHLKAALLPTSQVIPIKDGKLALGTWQAIMFVELDGPRANRKVLVQVIECK